MTDQPDTSVPWAQQRVPSQRVTRRDRKMVHSLPAWDPLPPGEITVRRGRER